ncbi:MAG: methyltransferase domain-containing protein [Candidatus Latescibacteria bacterium]|nr:methyltransferase domain-containing protein [Candidatus Latescibacterota bacterium]
MRYRYFIAPLLISVGITYGYSYGQALSETEQKQYAERYNRTASTTHAPLYEPLAEQIFTDYGLADFTGTGIDLGGGPGHLAVELAKKTPGMHWINADINPYFFHYTRKMAADADVEQRINTLEADAQNLPLNNETADIVVSRGSFHLWNDKPKSFSEIYRVLKPGGVALIGRGFSENLPVEVARQIRKQQSRGGGGLNYDVTETAEEFEAIMKALNIDKYRIIIPQPAGSEDVSYGVWVEFYKPGFTRRQTTRTVVHTSVPSVEDRPVYVLEPLEVRGNIVRDVVMEPMSESPGLQSSKSVINREDIEKQGADTVIDAMEYVPGAWMETRGRKVKQFFSVRGQKYPYPDYAIDGALYREFHELPYFFSSHDIDRIEIMRSSAAMLTGISGLGGVVNIIPRDYTEPETSWELEYGSFNTNRFHISHGGSARNVSYMLGLGTPHTDGPDNRFAAENMTNFIGNVNWRPTEKLSIRSSLLHMFGKRQLALAEPPATKKLQTSEEWYDPLQATMAQLKVFYLASEKASTEFHAAYANRDNTYNSQTDSSHTSTHDWDFEWSLNLVQSLKLWENNTIRAGGFYNHWISPQGKRFFTGRRTDLETYALVLVDEHKFGNLEVDGGIKWQRTYINEYGAYNIEGSAQGFGKVPSITDEWEPSIINWNVGASYLVTPNLSLNANLAGGHIKPREGTLTTDLEKPENEERIKADTGVEMYVPDAGNLTLTGFFVRQNNALALSGQTREVDGRIHELWINRDQDQLGLEFEVQSVPLYDKAKVFFNIAGIRSRAEINGSMKKNEELPEVIVGGGVQLWHEGYDLNLFLKTVSSYESTRFAADATTPVPIGDYSTLNLTMGKSFGTKLRTRVYLEAINLTGEEYSTVVGYPDYGRRYSIGIRQVLK